MIKVRSLPTASPPYKPEDQQSQPQYDHRADSNQNALQILLLPGGFHRLFGSQLLLDDHFRLFILDAGASNQQAMGVDAKGRAGHQRAEVISYFSLEKCGVIREHCLDLVDLISQFLAEYIKEKDVSLFQPIPPPVSCRAKPCRGLHQLLHDTDLCTAQHSKRPDT